MYFFIKTPPSILLVSLKQIIQTRSYLLYIFAERDWLRVLILIYEVEDIKRFPIVQDFASYCCRLVKYTKESNGKKYSSSGKKSAPAIYAGHFPRQNNYFCEQLKLIGYI